MTYYQSRTLKSEDLATLRSKVEAGLKEVGFGVLTEIDIQATMKKKLDKDYKPFLILGACNPVYADKVLTIDPHMSTLLPCNVTLRELSNGDIEISAVDPVAAMGSLGDSTIGPLAFDVQQKLERVIDKVV